MEAKGAKRHKRDHDDEDEDYNNDAEDDTEDDEDEFEEVDIIKVTNKNDNTLNDGLTEEGRRARDEVAAQVVEQHHIAFMKRAFPPLSPRGAESPKSSSCHQDVPSS